MTLSSPPPFPIRPDLVIMPNSTTPADRSLEMRRIRKHYVLRTIRDHGPLSRADVSKLCRYNLRTVSSLADELLENKLIRELDAVQTKRGRRPTPLEINHDAAFACGIEISGDEIHGVCLNLHAETITTMSATLSGSDATSLPGQVVDLISKMVTQGNGAGPLPPLAGVGLCIDYSATFAPDSDSGIHALASEIRRGVYERIGVPVLEDVPARMLASASLMLGCGQDYSTFVAMNVGNQIEAGIVLDRRIHAGFAGFAGRLETKKSPKTAREALSKLKSSYATMAELLRGLESQELKAQKALKGLVPYFADGISAVVSLLNPEAVILGGHFSPYLEPHMGELMDIIKADVPSFLYDTTEFRISEIKGRPYAMGGASRILTHIFNTNHVELTDVL